MARNWLEEQKTLFIKNEIFTLSILSAFRQGKGYPIYKKKGVSENERMSFHDFLKKELIKYESIYKKQVSDDKHIGNILHIQREVNSRFRNILYLRLGRVQKFFNIYLKYLWVLNWIPEPPHCPFDSMVINRLGAVDRFTEFDDVDTYKKLLKLARIQSKKEKKSIAEWELTFWNRMS